MLRSDLAAARLMWLNEVADNSPDRSYREQSDFLIDVNHDGEVLDFHAQPHTTGAWLALAGVHPKVIQTVLRHCIITLTMDTYGHLFPGQEADAVKQMAVVLTKTRVATGAAVGTKLWSQDERPRREIIDTTDKK